MTPIARILRTVGQILAAVVIVVPTFAALLATVGVPVDGKAWAAVAAAAVLFVTTVQNALEKVGLIPTLGSGKA